MANRDDRRQRPSTINVPTTLNRGLYSDSTPLNTPEGTYRFALNTAPGDLRGHTSSKTYELGNKKFSSFPAGYAPVGEVYVGDNETVIFLASLTDNSSIIGIIRVDGKFEELVNDSQSIDKDKLGFKVSNQIEAIYRVRGACDKTIYFVQKDKKPRYFNISKPEDFKNPDGTWKASLFSLQKNYEEIPVFSNVEVLDNGGKLLPGSYNISIQLLDSDLNPSEWVTTTETINIYNDSLSDEYREINGSINSEVEHYNFPNTSKAIRVEVSNLDTSYPYYRLAFIEATGGSGLITGVKYTDLISVNKNFFTYTGENYLTTGTEGEIMMFTDIIESAESIAQIENRLLLMNLKGKKSKYCALQKYASKITADCVTKKVNLSSLQKDNPKNPTINLESVGYMPGEIYSFGIVYIYEDKSLSPVFHIPGKNPDVGDDHVFNPISNAYGMSTDNSIESQYIPNRSCEEGSSYWGRDSEGVSLRAKNVRHHRFPLRSEIDAPLVTSRRGEVFKVDHYQVKLDISGLLKTPRVCGEGDNNCTPVERESFEVRVTYKNAGEHFVFSQVVNPYQYEDPESLVYDLTLSQLSPTHSTNQFTDIKVFVSDINGNLHDINYSPTAQQYDISQIGDYFEEGIGVTISIEDSVSEIQDVFHEGEILGINFSNIEVPSEEEIGEKIIGYYIVRNERTEFDKTILDTGVLVPTLKNSKYTSQGLLQPSGTYTQNKKVYGLIHPEHKFKEKKYFGYDEILQEGNFKVVDTKYGKVNFDDVHEGSAYDSDHFKSGSDDGSEPTQEAYTKGLDGFSINIISRDSIVEYENKKVLSIKKEDIDDSFYLPALGSRTLNDGEDEVYNISSDNKIGFVSLKDESRIPQSSNLPYVVLKRNNLEVYSDFRVLPYYKQTVNPVMFDESSSEPSNVSVFSGDSYISPVRYVNTMFWENRIADRATRGGKLAKIAGIFIAAAGILLSVFSGGLSLGLVGVGAGIAIGGAGLLLSSSGIKKENWSKAYGVEYDNGLRETVLDSWVKTFYRYDRFVGQYFPNPWTGQTRHSAHHAKSGPSDDTIQWIGDCITDLWFDTTINTSIRTSINGDTPDFLGAPGPIESGQNSPIKLWEHHGKYFADSNQRRYPVSSLENHLANKLLEFSPENNDGKAYLGIALGELYEINPDYERINKQKPHTHLAQEYDCCTDCGEEFPHRWRWSEQSFKEELTDNYRVLLPNNYRDLEGNSGEITNAITFGEKLYIHTREAFYDVPKNHQERVTGEIVSFIGTGSFFEIPPRKMSEGKSGMSPGLQHKWGAIETPEGYFFPSENMKTIFYFNGEILTPISDYGLRKWFRNNFEIGADKEYSKVVEEEYPLKDNPSNRFGTGFIAAYDRDLRRVIFTKKDFVIKEGILNLRDSKVIYHNDSMILFRNYQAIIDEKKSLKRSFVGFENGKMKFSYLETVTTSRERLVRVPPVYGPPVTYTKKYYSAFQNVDPDIGQNPGGDPGEITPIGGTVVYRHYPSGEVRTRHISEYECVEIVSTQILTAEDIILGCQPTQILEDTPVIEEGYTRTEYTEVEEEVKHYEYVNGTVLEDFKDLDKSWTISFSLENLKEPEWISWHSYLPNMYFHSPRGLFSWVYSDNFGLESSNQGLQHFWKHNDGSKYGNFYGKKHPFILEIPLSKNPLQTRIWNHIILHSLALRYDEDLLQSYEERSITFNKAIIYNETQCSGLLELTPKNEVEDDVDFMRHQIIDVEGQTILERRERDWSLNDFRDLRTNYNSPIWRADLRSLQDNYYIDKVLNEDSLDDGKEWSELESFRGKYLMVRLIFDKFEDVQLSLDYLIENVTSQEG